MALSTTEQLDYLWKKVGYGVTKTDTAANKLAYNEGTPSPLLLRADKLWAQAGDIPASKPAATSSVVKIYKDGASAWSATVKCTEDLGASDNRTWKTNFTDWIPPEFGATYLVSVYIDNDNATSPQSTGTQIFAAGASGSSNDEWFFDYQSGVLHFIGLSLPTSIASGVTGKSIFISGARYIGTFGISTSETLSANTVVITTSANIGNLTIADTTISSITTNSNITLDPNGSGYVSLLANTTITGNLVSTNANLGNLATANFFSGDGGLLSNISAANITGSASLGNVSANALSANTITSNTVVTSTIVSGNLTITNITAPDTVIDSFTLAQYRTAKYIIKASSDNGYESLEVLLIHDSSNSFITIYGAISTIDDDIITISSNVSSGNVKLYATGSGANTVVNLIGTYVTD